jgi:competence protein ComEC
MRLIVLSCAWILGIFMGGRFQLPSLLIFCGLLPVPAAFVWPEYRQKLVLLALSLVLFFGGAVYSSSREYHEPPLSLFNGRSVEVQGIVEATPELNNNAARLELSARAVTVDGKTQKTSGSLLVFVPLYPEYHYGDILKIQGKLSVPPDFQDFDYQAYLAGKGIFSIMQYPAVKMLKEGESGKPLAWIYSFRLRLARSLSAALPEPQAGLAQGILLGIRSHIPDTLKNNLSVSGTTHLLAISGMNLTIIAGVLITLGLWFFGRRYYIYVWLALIMIWFYSLLTGMQPPVIRSAIMASLFLLAELLGRQKNLLAALVFSAAIMAAVTPRVLWNVSFQLSFLAMIGLVFLAPPLQDAAKKGIVRVMGENNPYSSLVGLVSDSLCISLGAIIGVWPVIVYYFGTISIIAPLSTLLVAPVLSPIIGTAALTALAGLVSPPAAQVIGWTAWVFLSYMLWMVNACAGPALASFNSVPINGAVVWTYYSLMALIIRFRRNLNKSGDLLKTGLRILKTASDKTLNRLFSLPKKVVLIPLLLIALIAATGAATIPDKELHVYILDVGEGDAILVRNGRQNILIDAGPEPQPVLLGLGKALPFWDRGLDLVVLTHPHLDHLGGMIEVLRNYQVQQVLTTGLTSSTPHFKAWNDLLKTRAVSTTLACAGQCFCLTGETKLEVLSPSGLTPPGTAEDMENNGIVLRLSRGKIGFLFTADAGPETEAELVRQRADLDCTVLKVAHHGSDSSSTAEFLSVARPEAVVISVGADNRFGHPGPAVISRLQEFNIRPDNIFRTDLSGTIELTTDGSGLWVKTER